MKHIYFPVFFLYLLCVCVCEEHGVPGGSEGEGRDCSVSGYRTVVPLAIGPRHQCADEDPRFAAQSAVNAPSERRTYTQYH